MNVTDNFLPKEVFKKLQNFVAKNDFKIIDIGANRLISVLEAPEFVLNYLNIHGLKIITAFLRESYDGFDNQLNIHADNLMPEKKTSPSGDVYYEQTKVHTAGVLYINNPEEVTPNGTQFFIHEKYHYELPENVSEEEYNRMLKEDAKDEKKWVIESQVHNIPNRFLTYNARLFHDKFPSNIDKGNRVVLVIFYTKI